MRATILSFCFVSGLLASSAHAAEPQRPMTRDEATVRRNVDRYVQAFDRRDAKALSMLWAPQAVYVNPDTGKRAQGRSAIEAAFKSQFEGAGPEKLRVKVSSIRFVTSDVAIEDGIATVIATEEEPSESSYTAVHVKHGDEWLLDSVRETTLPPPAAAADQLGQLAWLEGDWSDQDENATLRSTYRWTANHAFLTQAFTLIVGELSLQGTQVIGWDPAAKQIRSWAFDSSGGFAEAVWQRDGDRWLIRSKTTLADGKRGSAINVLRPIDDSHCAWKSTARQIDDELLPNVEEIVVARQPDSAQEDENTLDASGDASDAAPASEVKE